METIRGITTHLHILWIGILQLFMYTQRYSSQIYTNSMEMSLIYAMIYDVALVLPSERTSSLRCIEYQMRHGWRQGLAGCVHVWLQQTIRLLIRTYGLLLRIIFGEHEFNFLHCFCTDFLLLAMHL